MTAKPHVLLAGGTGYLGRHLAKRLRDIVKLVVVCRNMDPDRNPLGLPAIEFGWSPHQVRSVAGNVEGGVIVHLVGSGRDSELTSIWEANVRRTQQLVAFADALGLSRIVYMSGYGVSEYSTSVYYRTKAYAEQIIRSAPPRVTPVILRSSYVVGRGDELTPWIWARAATGRVGIPGSGRYRIQPIWLDDVIEILVRACELGTDVRGGSYPLLGDAISFRNFVTDVAQLVDAKVEIDETDLETAIQTAVRSEDPVWSLDELGILVSDVVGPSRNPVFGVALRPYSEIIGCLRLERETGIRN